MPTKGVRRVQKAPPPELDDTDSICGWSDDEDADLVLNGARRADFASYERDRDRDRGRVFKPDDEDPAVEIASVAPDRYRLAPFPSEHERSPSKQPTTLTSELSRKVHGRSLDRGYVHCASAESLKPASEMVEATRLRPSGQSREELSVVKVVMALGDDAETRDRSVGGQLLRGQGLRRTIPSDGPPARLVVEPSRGQYMADQDRVICLPRIVEPPVADEEPEQQPKRTKPKRRRHRHTKSVPNLPTAPPNFPPPQVVMKVKPTNQSTLLCRNDRVVLPKATWAATDASKSGAHGW